MRRERVEDDPGEWHRPVRAGGLRRCHLRLLTRNDHQLLPDVEGPPEEVDLIQLDPDRLTLPQPGTRTQHD